MAYRFRKRNEDIVAGVGVALRAIRDSADVFPPLKSAVATVIVVWEISNKTKSNKKECRRLACRAAEIVQNIWVQTRNYNEKQLSHEVQQSIGRIQGIFNDIVAFMERLDDQGFFARYAHQDDNKKRIEHFTKLLDEAMLVFGLNLQLSIHMRLTTFQEASRGQHGEVLDLARMSEEERLVRAAGMVNLSWS